MTGAKRVRRFEVRIATNLGPVAISRFSHEPAFARSKLWLRDGERASLDSGERFAGFVDDLGPLLLRGLGLDPLPAGMYMEIDQDIDAGRSWQLGTLVAMILASAGRLAGPDEKDAGLLFCTGEVAHSSGAVRPVDLVAEKLRASRAALVERPADCIWLVPEGNAAEAARVDLPPGVTLRAVERIDELPALLGLAPAEAPAVAGRRGGWPGPKLALPLVVAALAGAFLAGPTLRDLVAPAATEDEAAEDPGVPAEPGHVLPPRDNGPAPPEPEPETEPPAEPEDQPETEAEPAPEEMQPPVLPVLAIEIAKRRPQPGQSCLVQNFDHSLPPVLERATLPPDIERLATLADDSRLCGLDIRILPAEGPPLYVLGSTLLEPADGAGFERIGTLDGVSPLTEPAGVTLRLKPDRAVTYRIDLVAGLTPVPPDAAAAIDDPAGRAALEAAGYGIRRLTQRLEHARERR